MQESLAARGALHGINWRILLNRPITPRQLGGSLNLTAKSARSRHKAIPPPASLLHLSSQAPHLLLLHHLLIFLSFLPYFFGALDVFFEQFILCLALDGLHIDPHFGHCSLFFVQITLLIRCNLQLPLPLLQLLVPEVLRLLPALLQFFQLFCFLLLEESDSVVHLEGVALLILDGL